MKPFTVSSTAPAALLAVALFLTACTKKDETAPAAANASQGEPATPVASIDGKPISRDEYDFYAQTVARKPPGDLTPTQRDQILEDLIRLHIVADRAVERGLDKDKEVAAAIDLTRLNLLMQAAVKQEFATPPTEQEMRAEYETFLASQPKYEYRVRHIVVATEQFAQSLIESIDQGASFADVARKHSMDTGSKERGGDLEWITPSDAPNLKPFVDALMGLQKGQVTRAPVQTGMGWHIIKLEDTRDLQVQDYADLQTEMRQRVQQKRVQAYLENLRKARKIEKTLEQPAAQTPPA